MDRCTYANVIVSMKYEINITDVASGNIFSDIKYFAGVLSLLFVCCFWFRYYSFIYKKKCFIYLFISDMLCSPCVIHWKGGLLISRHDKSHKQVSDSHDK